MKHRKNVFCVCRHDFSGNEVVCCVTATPDRADELVGEYTQLFKDKGFSDEEFHFYATAAIFYNE